MKLPALRYATTALLLLAPLTSTLRADDGLSLPHDNSAQPDARLDWWRQARFGMSIHWGLYAVPAGAYDGKWIDGPGESIMNRGKIPVAAYARYAETFNPTNFSADEWVGIAKAAGMKYMVFTAKHHDGFGMYHSRVDGYNIYDATPFKRDPVRELAAAAARQSLKLGLYYSQAQDWRHPGGGACGGHWDPAQDGDYDHYLAEKSIPQLKELLDNYNPAVLWFDTPIAMRPERTRQFLDLLKTRPNLIFNNRLGNEVRGDAETPEQTIPASGFIRHDWESCLTINDTGGYKSYDADFKSTKTLLRDLIDIVSKGGNCLLNVGPTADGIIPPPEAARLKEIGVWLAANGDAIYGTTHSPFGRQLAWGRCTQKPGKLYLSVFDWPRNGQLTVPIFNQVTKAYLLAHPDRLLTVHGGDEGAKVTLPIKAPTPIAGVVVLEIDGPPAPIPPIIQQAADGELRLLAPDAGVHGSTLVLEGVKPNLGMWTNPAEFPYWQAIIHRPGTFAPEINYAVPDDGSVVQLSAGDQAVSVPTPSTGDWHNYQTVKLPPLKIEKSGPVTITVKATAKSRVAVMNLWTVTLTPADPLH
jgi:alpha-L-fucosidase